MSEKRFIIAFDNNQNIYDAEKKCYYSSIDAKKLCDLLNKLNNLHNLDVENFQILYEQYKDALKIIKNLREENEEFNEELMECDSFKRLYEEKIERLEKENEQLKQFKEKVFSLFDKDIARNEEAIEWGKETGADYGAIGFYNHMLYRLKKELKE